MYTLKKTTLERPMKLTIRDTGQTIDIEVEGDKLHEVSLYDFSRRPIKALFDGHGQPVKVVDGGTKFYVLPVGVYEAMVSELESKDVIDVESQDISEDATNILDLNDINKLSN